MLPFGKPKEPQQDVKDDDEHEDPPLHLIVFGAGMVITLWALKTALFGDGKHSKERKDRSGTTNTNANANPSANANARGIGRQPSKSTKPLSRSGSTVSSIRNNTVNDKSEQEKEKEVKKVLSRNASISAGLGSRSGSKAAHQVMESLARSKSESSKIEPSNEPDMPPEAFFNPASRSLWLLYGKLWDLQMKDDPIVATMLGDYRFNDCLADLSLEARTRMVDGLKDLYKQAKEIKPEELASETDKQNYEFLMEMLRLEISAKTSFDSYEFPTNHLFGAHLMLAQTPNLHPWRNPKDCMDYIRRLSCFGVQVDQIMDACQLGMENKFVLPVQCVDYIIAQCRSQIVPHAQDSVLYKVAKPHFETLNVDPETSGLLEVISSVVVPGYRKLEEFFEREYRSSARKTPGFCTLPKGEELYKEALRYFTSTDYTADELFDLGKREVARVRASLDVIVTELRQVNIVKQGSLKTAYNISELVEVLRGNPTFFAKTGEQIIGRYQAILEKAKKAIVPTYFKFLPSVELRVEAIEEFRQESSPPAHYQPAPDDNSRPGVFYVNTYHPNMRPLYMMEAIALHEGIPGHHMQISIAQQLNGLPRIRKQPQGFVIGYLEGWGLYSEYLGEELGFYQTPIDKMGRLLTEIWRAARLVVDTGLHKHGWTRQQAIRYLRENTGLPETDAASEVDRYSVLPGQACAYKVGEICILKLKDKCEKRLQERFSYAEFHDVILRNGGVPLRMLESNVDAWLATKLA